MNRPILNIAEVELKPRPPAFAATGPAAERFDARMGAIASKLGAQKLGYNVTSVPGGKPQAFRFVGRESNAVPYWDGE